MKRRKRERERVGSVEFSWRWREEAGNGVGGEQLEQRKDSTERKEKRTGIVDLLIERMKSVD